MGKGVGRAADSRARELPAASPTSQRPRPSPPAGLQAKQVPIVLLSGTAVLEGPLPLLMGERQYPLSALPWVRAVTQPLHLRPPRRLARAEAVRGQGGCTWRSGAGRRDSRLTQWSKRRPRQG